MSTYLAGLNTDTQKHIWMFQPKSVHECLLLGHLYETAHPRKTSSQNWSQGKLNNNSSKGLLQYPKPSENKMYSNEGSEKLKEGAKQPQKFLSK